MLQAKNGRQFNLAAKSARAFLATKDIKLSHHDALELVAQVTGHASYAAAQALLEGPSKGVSPAAGTWRELAHAIGTLKEEQLDMQVQVTEGCDCDGNATFSQSVQLLMANDDCIAAGTPMFPDNQPVLLVEEFNPECDTEDAYRVMRQLEEAAFEPSQVAEREIAEYGLEVAIHRLNREFDVRISVGKFVAFSSENEGFWNINLQSFVRERAAATGFDTIPEEVAAAGLTIVPYDEAVDY